MRNVTDRLTMTSVSRSRLGFSVFEQIGENQWKLILTPYYALLFDSKLSDIIAGQASSWLESRSCETKLIVLDNLKPDEVLRIEAFISDYKQYVILGKNSSIIHLFDDELDATMALDYNFRDAQHGVRTEVGELKYQAKFRRMIADADQLSIKLTEALPRLPGLSVRKSIRLTYVPVRVSKKYDLPRYLVQTMAERLQEKYPVLPVDMIIHPQLIAGKPEVKDISVTEKIKMWKRLYENQGVLVDDSLEGCDLVIVDDLYQSGVTLWSYARFLKSKGATSVRALVCEKSWGDHDNRRPE